MDPQTARSELAADTMAAKVTAAGTKSSPAEPDLRLAEGQVQRQPKGQGQGQAGQQVATREGIVEAAKKRLAMSEPETRRAGREKTGDRGRAPRILAARKDLDERAEDPYMSNKVRAEEQNTAKLNRAPVDIAVTGDAWRSR